jgi:hypothetical protein
MIALLETLLTRVGVPALRFLGWLRAANPFDSLNGTAPGLGTRMTLRA